MALNFNFDKEHIKNTSYVPQGYVDLEEDQRILRKGTIALLSGKIRLPVHVVNQIQSNNKA